MMKTTKTFTFLPYAKRVGMILATVAVMVSVNSFNMNIVSASTEPSDPLLEKWSGPYGGIPPFDKVKISDMKPALEAAMAENLAEIDKIANDPAPPTFENTIVALERSGQTLDRVSTIYYIWSSNMNSDEFGAVESEMDPKLAAHFDKITQNEKLFKRIETVYNNEQKKNAKPSERGRLTWLDYTNFVRQGAKLSADQKKRLSEINQSLAGLFTKFSQNLLGDESQLYVVIDDRKGLAGLPQSIIDAAAQDASAKGLAGKWVIRNTRSSVDPFLTYAADRALREKVWRMFVNRGDNGDSRDNNAIITQILQLRAERAKLLGYATHAHWRLEPQMAKTPENAMALMEKVWPAAVARVKEEVADMQAFADKEKAGIKIEPWDYHYYMEKVRKEKFDLDQNEVKPYLQLDKIREAMFWVAGELFNFNFKPVTNIPVYHPDVTVYDVTDKTTGKHIGL